MIKVATWNVCLGLQNKKDFVYDILQREKIAICMIQEAEIKKDYPVNLLSSKDFKNEQENCSVKARCAALVRNNINYTRRHDLEGLDNCIIILDVHAKKNYRLINVYRSFVAPTNLTLKVNFERQVGLINVAISTFQTEKPAVVAELVSALSSLAHYHTQRSRVRTRAYLFRRLNKSN